MSQGRILVIRGGAIGDFILTLPALAALRQQFPGAHLEVLGYPHIASLAVAGGLINRVQPIEARGLAGFFAAGGALDELIQDYFAGFDLIVSYLYDPDHIFQRNVTSCTAAHFIQGPHRPDEHEGLHATEVFLKPLQRLAIFESDAVPRLLIGEARHTPAMVALHPGSGSERKTWPEDHWRELLQQVVDRTPLRLLLVGGEAEGGKLDRLAGVIPKERLTLARSLPLVDLAGLLRQCRLFVGHDSGITHLAAALGLPCVVLWAHTARTVWEPRGRSVLVIETGSHASSQVVDGIWSALLAVKD